MGVRKYRCVSKASKLIKKPLSPGVIPIVADDLYQAHLRLNDVMYDLIKQGGKVINRERHSLVIEVPDATTTTSN